MAPGEFVGIMGPSGSGKTTLLNCVATIDTVTSGHILVDGRDITTLRSRALAKFRRDDLGFIFQDSNLLDTLTGFENIALALTVKGDPSSSIKPRVQAIARTLGVEDVLNKYPYQMSGGQKQRIAAARAMVADPKLVLADEPTGALDSRSTSVMLETLSMMNTELHATIMMVTHDSFAASFASRILFIILFAAAVVGTSAMLIRRRRKSGDAFWKELIVWIVGLLLMVWWVWFIISGSLTIPFARNGFRMVVFSVIIMIVVLFFRRGMMGDKEFTDLLFRRKKTTKEAAK